MKLYPSRSQPEARLRRLDSERRLLQRLRHPLINRLLGHFTEPLRTYFVFEVLPDGDLSLHLRRGPFSLDKAR